MENKLTLAYDSEFILRVEHALLGEQLERRAVVGVAFGPKEYLMFCESLRRAQHAKEADFRLSADSYGLKWRGLLVFCSPIAGFHFLYAGTEAAQGSAAIRAVEVQEAIEADFHRHICERFEGVSDRAGLVAVIERLEDENRKLRASQPRWISVKERLPKYEKPTWVFGRFSTANLTDPIGLCRWNPARLKFERAFLSIVIEDDITEWLELLPPAPEKEGER